MRTSRDYLLQLLMKPLPRQRWLALALLVSAATFLIWHSSDHTAASPFSPPWDKIAHFVFFAGLACLGWIVAGGSGTWRNLAVLVTVAAIGAADEFTQGMNPLRVMDFEDFLSDVTGALAAIVVLTIISGKLRRRGARLHAASQQPAR